MGHFEGHYIQISNPWTKKIKIYKRYIDDLFFIWDGTELEFELFTAYLNQNEYGITLTGKVSSETMDYLDISLTTHNENIITKTHFKDVDTNSRLDFKSAHYKKLLTNVPYGQFRRLGKNCTLDRDFETQSQVMSNRFKEKHYPKQVSGTRMGGGGVPSDWNPPPPPTAPN